MSTSLTATVILRARIAPDEVGLRQLRDRAAAREMERGGELRSQELEHVARALLAARREAPERHPSGKHRLRAEGERGRDVGAPPDATVEQHLQPAPDRIDDLR